MNRVRLLARLALAVVLLTAGSGAAPAMAMDPLQADAHGRPAGQEESACGGAITAVADAAVSEGAAATPFGIENEIRVATPGGDEWRSLIAFDIPVPDGSTVFAAELEFEVSKAVADPLPYTFDIRSVQANWEEAGVTWATQPPIGQSYGNFASHVESGTIVIDVTTLITQWVNGAEAVRSVAVLPSSGVLDVLIASREAGTPPRLSIICAPNEPATPPETDAADAAQEAALTQLRQQSQPPVLIQPGFGGAVRFAEFRLPLPPQFADDPPAGVAWFIEEYRHLLRLADPAGELQLDRRSDDGRHFFFRQRHNAIPVFPTQLVVHTEPGFITGLGGNYVPGINLGSVPRLPAEQAVDVALALAGDGAMEMGDVQLRYVNAGLLGEEDTSTHLAWRVGIASIDQAAYYIDANGGQLVLKQSMVADAFDLDLHTQNGGNAHSPPFCGWPFSGATVWFDENGQRPGVTPDAEGTAADQNIRNVYNYFRNTHGRDSYNGNGSHIGMFLDVVFRNAQGNPITNAAWMCYLLQFSNNTSSLDVVGHEFTHAVTDNEAALVYENQSGALNESFSDVFGQMVDNSDWFLAEGTAFVRCSTLVPAGAIRDMSSPPNCNDPDHMTAALSGDGQGLRTLPAGTNPDCATNDCGFVHTNSGIPNKASFLVTAGGTHNGFNITGIGQTKSQRLFYNVLANRLTANSQFIDMRNASVAEADAALTSFEACQVQNAYASVGLGSGDSDCDGTDNTAETDADGDFRPDTSDNCPNIWNSSQTDTDTDNFGDACDRDSDNDGVCDLGGPFPAGSNGVFGAGCVRGQGPGPSDNCRLIANTAQVDSDGDLIGDACEDSDGDGRRDPVDNCPNAPNPDQKDTDGDTTGDACDNDRDGDGSPNASDNCPDKFNPSQANGDGDSYGDLCDKCPTISSLDNADSDKDGLGNACDPDDDNDGVCDIGGPLGGGGGVPIGGCVPGRGPGPSDNCRTVYNPDQLDTNGNGVGTACDGAEREGMRQARDRFFEKLVKFNPVWPVLPMPVPICPICDGDGSLPANFQVDVDVRMSTPFFARVIDSDGVVLTTTPVFEGRQVLTFFPETFTSTGPPGGPCPLCRNAAGAVGEEVADSVPPDKVYYTLEIFPASDTDLSQDYTLAVTFDDGDGVPAASDNCPDVANLDQADFDRDGQGDVCDAEDDGDGFSDSAESGVPLCDGAVNHDSFDDGVPDDGCPGGPAQAGSFSETEFKIGTGSVDACGNNGWPLELVTTPASTANKYNISDLASFVAPVRRMGKSPGQSGFSSRWDLSPGSGALPGQGWINILDLATTTSGTTGHPPMLGGAKALNQTCPFPP